MELRAKRSFALDCHYARGTGMLVRVEPNIFVRSGLFSSGSPVPATVSFLGRASSVGAFGSVGLGVKRCWIFDYACRGLPTRSSKYPETPVCYPPKSCRFAAVLQHPSHPESGYGLVNKGAFHGYAAGLSATQRVFPQKRCGT